MTRTTQPTVAVVGAGVSGLTAAYLLSRSHSVTLFEAEPRLGGHANTQVVRDAAGAPLAVDTGFIVHNDRTYPKLRKLFGELGIATRPTEMSMSISDPATGLEYAGGLGAGGVFAQRRRVADPRFLGVLGQVGRFHRRAAAFLASTSDVDLTSLGDFLDSEGFSPRFRRLYAVPLVSCVWSTGAQSSLQYPARYLFRFLERHGMLSFRDSPQWSTVVGGSRTYVDAIADRLESVRAGRPVRGIVRGVDGVRVTDAAGETACFDRVVVATHADTALELLTDADPAEKEVLSAFEYSRNETVLHTDASLLPRTPKARAAWNFRTTSDDRPPVVTYWMNRLQGLDTETQFLVTLNARERIDPAAVLAVMDYRHPVYDAAAVAAQSRLPTLNTDRTTFAGAYHGWGFHEDGCRSGVAAAAAFGVEW
ncbi:FAD-dependent oxidoreductase [Kribbella sp. NBC_01484]|uniref:NAD(P)/FAD-dependent oxidoreductase n=1 Tax=Kribbella sp. NBC_01484 TaxID=2903579 RepID=UPI002E32031F|nr:FAD-dependent oxidoreductase [Kribbella sp. NBC_01484]